MPKFHIRTATQAMTAELPDGSRDSLLRFCHSEGVRITSVISFRDMSAPYDELMFSLREEKPLGIEAAWVFENHLRNTDWLQMKISRISDECRRALLEIADRDLIDMAEMDGTLNVVPTGKAVCFPVHEKRGKINLLTCA